jgi:hypothetical protein
VPHATDPQGRPASPARLTQGSTQESELIFSARTYRLLGGRTTLTAASAGMGPAGTVIGGWAPLSETVASRLPRTPHGSPDASPPAC